MADKRLILAEEIVSGKQGEAYITIDGSRYHVMSLKKIEVKFDKEKVKLPRLGSNIDANKAVGGSGTFSATCYYCSDVLRRKMIDYITDGVDFYFTIQITNDDPSTTIGAHTVIIEGCNLDTSLLAAIDVDNTALEEDLEGTYEYIRMPQEFKLAGGEM